MKNNFNILSISKSIEYFQTSFNNKTQPKVLEEHLSTIQQLMASLNQNQGPVLNIILSVLPIFTQRYYELSTLKISVIKQEYLLVKFVKILTGITHICLLNQSNYRKDITVILMSGTVTLTKTYFERTDVELTDLKSSLLQFSLQLLQIITLRKDFKIQEIYPKQYSLCSLILKKNNLPLKHFSFCLKIMEILIKNNKRIAKEGLIDKFSYECCKRLVQDLKFITNIYNSLQLPFQQNLKQLVSTLVKIQLQISKPNFSDLLRQKTQQQILFQNARKDLFIYTVLAAQLCKINIEITKFDLYKRQIINESYKTLFINICNKLLTITADLSLKKRQISKLSYLVKIIEFTSEQDPIFVKTVDLFQHIFRVKHNHQLITIPHHSTTIPLEQVQAYHNILNYPIKGLKKQYKTQVFRMIVQVNPFHELQPSILELIQDLIHQMKPKNIQILLKYFSDLLLKYEYNLNMSVTKLYSHLQILFIIRFLFYSQNSEFSIFLLSNIYLTLGQKTETLRSLQASYVEQQLLIAVTLEIVFHCYNRLTRLYKKESSIKNRIKQAQNSITLVQKILNQLSEDSYLIRLITTYTLLSFTTNEQISTSLKPIQATLLMRNKNNLPLMANLLKISKLNSNDYQELAVFYMQYRGAQTVLRLLLRKIKIQTVRRCILTVQRWWLLFHREVIEYLNQKQMSKQGQNFPMNDGENVAVRNTLGVIIVEMQEKWIFYLKSQKRQSIIDILILLLQVNPKMVFFRSKFSYFLELFYKNLQETLGLAEPVNDQRKEKRDRKKMSVKILQPQKIQFYARLRLKIYKLLNLIPQQCWQLYNKEHTQPLSSLLLNQFQAIKKEYLFEGRIQLKVAYEQLKKLVSVLETL